jgi:hypothetical protein
MTTLTLPFIDGPSRALVQQIAFSLEWISEKPSELLSDLGLSFSLIFYILSADIRSS